MVFNRILFILLFSQTVHNQRTWRCRPQRPWHRWVSWCPSLNIYLLLHGRCWPRCQPSDSSCQRSCHPWEAETLWHWDMERARGSDKQTQKGIDGKKKIKSANWLLLNLQFLNNSVWYHFSCESASLRRLRVRWVMMLGLSVCWRCSVTLSPIHIHSTAGWDSVSYASGYWVQLVLVR